MKGDISRETFDVAKHYSGVRMQQGRVQTDADWNEQEALWLKGRAADGTVIDRHAIVTNCRGGHSWHNFGMAVDLVPDDTTKADFQCDWNAQHPAWKSMARIGKALGLRLERTGEHFLMLLTSS